MEEAKEYKAYLKALKKATESVNKDKKKPVQSKRILSMTTFSDGGMCRGAGAAVRGTNFKGVM
jgi:hypothetical protein